MNGLDFAEIRRLVIIAMFSDDSLYGQLVLKGGNAISLVYGLGKRSSLDVDFSIEGEFSDQEEIKGRIQRALTDRFDQAGYIIFDYRFELRPSQGGEKNPRWGGYRVEFKLIEKTQYNKLTGEVESVRRNALVVGPAQQRTFTIDISKYEYCAGKTEKELESYTVFVYSPAMMAVEKLRAICQQMPEYPLRGGKFPRARDFYDICQLVDHAHVDFGSEEVEGLLSPIFAAKEVDLQLIARIPNQRDFHRTDWPSVQDSISGPAESFDFYFEKVIKHTGQIKIPLDKKAAT